MWTFLYDRWSVFDSVLVFMSCVDVFLLTPVFSSMGQELAFLSVLRILRLLRLLRVVRLIRLFHELWALVAGIVDAFSTLVWAWVLLGLLIYIFAIFTTRAIGKHHSADEDPLIKTYFGSMLESTFTLFSITTTEGWPEVARTCMKAQSWTWIVFISYLYMTTFAVMNVVVAVIVENTLDQAGAQREKFVAKQRVAQHASCIKIYKFFNDADADGDGSITAEEFRKEMQQPEVKEGLRQLGIDLRQAENLFSILDYDESGALDAEEFVGGRRGGGSADGPCGDERRGALQGPRRGRGPAAAAAAGLRRQRGRGGGRREGGAAHERRPGRRPGGLAGAVGVWARGAPRHGAHRD